MYGWELKQERRRLRHHERELARRSIFAAHQALALDEEDLVIQAELGNTNAQGNAVKRRLVLAALGNLGVTKEVIAELWGVTPEQLADWNSIPLLDNTGYAADIEKHVAEQIPETAPPVQPGATSGAHAPVG